MQPGQAATGAEVTEPDPMGRIWTIPNLISLARLAGIPVFLWLVLGPRSQAADWWAVGLLIASSASDWLDGKIARALNQQSRLGQLLDPAADRLYIVATVVALAIRGIIPWWLVAALAVREVMLAGVLAVLRRRGWGALQVSFVGKAATLCLLYAFPLLFIGAHASSYAETARVAGWAFAIWGSALYWCAGLLYVVQARRLLAAGPPAAGGPGAGGTAAGGIAADGTAADGTAADGTAADGTAADGTAADGTAADGTGAGRPGGGPASEGSAAQR